ncbi:uncharacterized protein LOC113383208 [Ctenocephalides felis]|nr:uncharacterized protein LOC113383208 [Ctenocephalides felis]
MRRWSMPWDSAHVAAPHGRYHYYPPHYHHVTSHASGCHYPHPQHQAQISAGATARGLGAVGGVSKLSVPVGGGSGTTTSCSDRSRSTTPDSIWQPSSGSQDGLAEAIQLLSCRPGIRPYNQLTSQQQPSYHSHIQTTNQPPVPSQSSEPYHYHQDTGQMPFLYSMWSGHERSGLPFIRLPDMPEQQVLPDETGSSETKKQSSNVHKPP